MAIEEVAAFASYENTAKNARALSRRTEIRRRSSAAVYPTHELGTHHEDIEIGAQSKIDVSRHSTVSLGSLAKLKEEIESPEKLDEEYDEITKETRNIFGVFFDGVIPYKKEHKMQLSLRSCTAAVNATMPWLRHEILHKAPLPNVWLFIEMCCRGIGQVYFQNNPISGLLILIGLFVQSSRVAVHGTVALVCGNLIAILLGFDKGLIVSGLFGYNSVLVGLALAAFYSLEEHSDYYGPVFVGAIVFSSFSSVLFVMMGKLLVPYKSPPMTLPFNVATIMFLLATANMSHVAFSPVRSPALPDYSQTDDNGTVGAKEFFAGVIRGIGQVYLADNIASGLLVLAGIAVCSRISAAAAVVGSALGAGVAILTGVPARAIEQGFYGFNCSLSVTAIFMFYAPSIGTTVLGVLAGIMTVLAQQALSTFLEPYGLPFMTLPFCVIALPFVIIQGTTSLVVAVPLSSMTVPEDHLRRVKMLADGFCFLKEAIAEKTFTQDGTSVPAYGRKMSKYVRSLSQAIDSDDEQDTDEKAAKMRARFQKAASTKELSMRDSAILIFEAIDTQQTGEITLAQFTDFLKGVGLDEKAGLLFAAKAFTLMDLDDSETLTRSEFVHFAMASQALERIRSKIAKFFDFVDVDNNGRIDMEELDSARDYLGQPSLTDDDHDALILAVDHFEDGSFEVVDIINFVTISKLKILVAPYHNKDV